MKATLDRIENDMAVLLIRNDETIKINIPMTLMPKGCSEGDIMDIIISKDEKATEDARKRVSDLIEKLKSKR